MKLIFTNPHIFTRTADFILLLCCIINYSTCMLYRTYICMPKKLPDWLS